jgi:hypothetical protein
LKLSEARIIAGTLRNHCGNLFPFTPVTDSLPVKIQDGLRYAESLAKKASIQEGIRRAKEGGEDQDLPAAKKKKLKEVYLVSKKKFHSVATQAELSSELDPGLLDTEDGHRIIQAKIRYRNSLRN